MCRRHWCKDCGDEMIHRDHRKGYESASAFGQVVSRDGPRTFTVGDIDLYVLKLLGRRPLLRLVEHKQPGAPIKPMQKKTLSILNVVFAAAIEAGALHPQSGIYLMRGEVYASPNGRRETRLGRQRVWDAQRQVWFMLESQEEVFTWMDGRTPPSLRQSPRPPEGA